MDHVAAADQMQAACRQMATAAATLRDALHDAGFTDSQAQALVEIWVDRTIEHWNMDDTRNM